MTTNSKLQIAAENAKQALAFVAAAERVLGPDYSNGDVAQGFMQDLAFLAPASALVGHAVELGLIAYKSAFGAKGGDSNHDLIARMEAAERVGLFIHDDFRKAVQVINGPHVNMQFRYAGKHTSSFVRPRDAVDFVKPTLQSIYRSVAERAFGPGDFPFPY